MKLRPILEAFYNTTQYWILPNGKVHKLRGGHEDYLVDKGMTYSSAFNNGYIRLAITDDDGLPSAEWSSKATSAAKKALGKIVQKTDKLYYDIVKPVEKKGGSNRAYLNHGITDYKGYLKLR